MEMIENAPNRQRRKLQVANSLVTMWTIAFIGGISARVEPGRLEIPSDRKPECHDWNRRKRLAWALVHPVVNLEPPDDVELFCRVAGNRFPDDPHLPRFMTALGGIPLAIELVAARAHGRTSLAPLWAQWTRIGAALAAKPGSDAGRLTSLPHSIELSLASSRLTAIARRLFCLLGQLPAGLTAEDRNELLGDDGFDGEEALLRIGLAVERNGRLDLLPPIRDYAAHHHVTEWTESFKCAQFFLNRCFDSARSPAELDKEIPNIIGVISNLLRRTDDESSSERNNKANIIGAFIGKIRNSRKSWSYFDTAGHYDLLYKVTTKLWYDKAAISILPEPAIENLRDVIESHNDQFGRWPH